MGADNVDHSPAKLHFSDDEHGWWLGSDPVGLPAGAAGGEIGHIATERGAELREPQKEDVVRARESSAFHEPTTDLEESSAEVSEATDHVVLEGLPRREALAAASRERTEQVGAPSSGLRGVRRCAQGTGAELRTKAVGFVRPPRERH